MTNCGTSLYKAVHIGDVDRRQ